MGSQHAPANNGTYFQNIALTRESLDEENTKLEIGGKQYKMERTFSAWAVTVPHGPLVFRQDRLDGQSEERRQLGCCGLAGKIVVIFGPGYNQSTITPRPEGVAQEDLRARRSRMGGRGSHAKAKGNSGGASVAPPQLRGCLWAS